METLHVSLRRRSPLILYWMKIFHMLAILKGLREVMWAMKRVKISLLLRSMNKQRQLIKCCAKFIWEEEDDEVEG